MIETEKGQLERKRGKEMQRETDRKREKEIILLLSSTHPRILIITFSLSVERGTERDIERDRQKREKRKDKIRDRDR